MRYHHHGRYTTKTLVNLLDIADNDLKKYSEIKDDIICFGNVWAEISSSSCNVNS